MKKFLLRTILFLAPLIGLVIALELILAGVNRRQHGRFRVGEDVYVVIDAAGRPHPNVTTLYLGDSVARQLFPMHTEPSPNLLYLPSNQAISLAGQYCLLQKVLAGAPKLHHVYLFYTPRSWANDLDQIFTHDYFCGYFHTAPLVWEIWQVKHDPPLTESHLARWMLPNTMAENSYLNRSQSSYGVPIVPVGSAEAHPLSNTSIHFLAKMKTLCREHAIELSVLPCPCMGSAERFADVKKVYDAPIRFCDPDLFLPDQIHFKKANVASMQKRVIDEFQLKDTN